MRIRCSFLLLLLLAAAGSLHAQFCPPFCRPYPPPPPLPPRYLPPPRPVPYEERAFTVGLWAAFGGQWTSTMPRPNAESAVYGAIGAYGELSHHKLRPALEVRQAGGVILGTMGGARLGWRSGPAILYGEALFGTDHYNNAGLGSDAPITHVDGILSQAEFGVEILPPQHPNTGIRMAFNTGSFSAVPGSRPSSFSVGFLLRVP